MKTKKDDDMGNWRSLKAVQASWAYASVFLLIWNIADLARMHRISFLPFILLSSQMIVLFAARLIIDAKSSDDNNDDE